mmetsp:Transcript_27019/g.64084  ORF Transcript_27019/g.64084 Transcript_27019/m.64084 type:complete len:156 (-) Transcript_27019:122-589(-)|eukprot:CAMPEP_0177608234 /NCGR_PEP_ID=MMETSP0419_2-20121207/18354_1 /TAXON_ID=582737 /ORGANISM="Tetraselmis sp., Strain GSL018" /LENGTH=155 /DNA_ID=CAMNT_0019102893 /DNA_START=106 /DNA_END=573 /DNA_ORIENTATION=-
MNRRWRFDTGDQLASLLSLDQFGRLLPSELKYYRLANTTDIYAVYCALSSRGLIPKLAWSAKSELVYFLQNLGYCGAAQVETEEAVVPVSTSCRTLSLEALHSICFGDSHVVLALVSSSGTVTLQRIFSGLQPPEESSSWTAAVGEEHNGPAAGG